MNEAISDGAMCGSSTWRRTWSWDAPRSMADSSWVRSKRARLAETSTVTSGNVTTMCMSTTVCHDRATPALLK